MSAPFTFALPQELAAQEPPERQKRSAGRLFAKTLRQHDLILFRQEIDQGDEHLARIGLRLLGTGANVVERRGHLGERCRPELAPQVPDAQPPIESATRPLPPPRQKCGASFRHGGRESSRFFGLTCAAAGTSG